MSIDLYNIISTMLLQKPNKLNKNEINWIKIYLDGSKHIFDELSVQITELIIQNNGQIYLYQIPKIILFISKLYSSQLFKLEMKKTENIIILVKITIISIIEFSPIPNMDKEITEHIINASLELLETNIYPIQVIENHNCKIFGC
jgi:hypothetical protein